MLARLGGNFAAQIAGIALSFADRFIVVGLLLRTLGTDAYSDWVLLLSSAGLLSLAELGLNIYFGNVWQKAHATRDSAQFQRMLGLSLTCSAGLGLILLCVMLFVLLSSDLVATLSLKTLTNREADIVFLLLGCATASRAMRGGVAQIYRGRQVFALGAMIDMISAAVLVIVLVAIALAGGSLPLLAAGYFASDIFAGWGATLLDVKRRFPDLVFKPHWPRREEFIDLVRQLRWFALQQGAPVVWLQVPVLILGWLGVSGPSLVSFLILRTLVNFARTLSVMLSISVSVELTSSFHTGARADFLRRLGAFGAGLSGIAGAMAVAIALFGEAFVAIWTGHPDLFDYAMTSWMLAAALVAAPATPLVYTLMMCNLPKPAALANLVQIGTGIVAVAIFARLYGALGAAFGMAIGEALASGIVLPILAAGPLQLDSPRYFARCLITMAACALWCGLVGFALKSWLHPAELVSLSIVAMLWGVLGLVPALLAILPTAQKMTLLRIGRQVSARFMHV